MPRRAHGDLVLPRIDRQRGIPRDVANQRSVAFDLQTCHALGAGYVDPNASEAWLETLGALASKLLTIALPGRTGERCHLEELGPRAGRQPLSFVANAQLKLGADTGIEP